MNYFADKELACPCCGENGTNEKSLEMLNKARHSAGVPFVINSAYRCQKHNAKVKGSTTSSHMKGYAFDIKAKDSPTRYKVLRSLFRAGFKRVGVYETFIHVDNDPSKTEGVIWTGV